MSSERDSFWSFVQLRALNELYCIFSFYIEFALVSRCAWNHSEQREQEEQEEYIGLESQLQLQSVLLFTK